MSLVWGVGDGTALNTRASTSSGLAKNRLMLSAPPAGNLVKLLQRVRSGDQRAWNELVESFQRLVYSIPRRMGLSEEDSADVFQTTFLALYRNLDRIEDPRTLPKWLSVTASRESLRVKRISSRTTTLSDDAPSLDEILVSEEASAESNAIAATQNEQVNKALDGLQERCRELLRMLYSEDDISYEDISSQLGIPIGSIGPTRARCLEKLRKNLEGGGFFE